MAAANSGLDAASGATVDTGPTLALLGFFGVVTLGNVQGDVAPLDVDVALGLENTTLDDHIVAGGKVQVVAGAERGSALGGRADLLAVALLGMPQFDVCGRTGEELADRVQAL
ncbi:hypothetical protein D9M70_271150 [compost metagenome]